MARAVRVDALVLAALEVVLRTHLLGRAARDLPIWQATAHSEEALAGLTRALADSLSAKVDDRWQIEVVEGQARMGGGSQPLATMASRCLAIRRQGLSAEALERRLRAGPTPVIGRTRGAVLLLDMRSMLAGDGMENLLAALDGALRAAAGRESAEVDRSADERVHGREG
jgi:L-seryl-tRNA(Ser) seleniumtransferase